MLEEVEWGEFKLGNIFEIDAWIYGKNKKYMTTLDTPDKNSIAIISGTTENNGVAYYTNDKLSDEEIFKSELTISTRGEYSGTVFYHDEKFALANNILVMKMDNLTKNQKLFFAGIINALEYGGYSNYPRKETLKNNTVSLPVKSNNIIDFEFMEKFIEELEAYHIEKIETYLTVTGLKDFTLTEEEQNVLKEYDEGVFNDIDITDVFEVRNTKNILSKDIKKNSGNVPYLGAGSNNNSVITHISYNTQYIDKGNCIFIGGKTFVLTYQENDFFSNDSHNLALYLKNEQEKDKFTYLYLLTCIEKSLHHKYSWGDSISNKKIQNDKISIPFREEGPDFKKMRYLISAIQKLIIKDVVLYNNEKLSTIKNVVNN